MTEPFFWEEPAPQPETDDDDFEISDLSIDSDGLKSMSMDELKKLKDKLRKVVSSTAPKAGKVVYKRENKNRPREVSAKRREMRNQTRIVRRDPRFEESCGSFEEDQFKKDYAFLEQMKEKERKMIAKAARKEKDPEKKETLIKLKQRLVNQAVSEKQREAEKHLIEDLKNKKKEETGKAYVKRSDVKAALLIQKYQQLKRSGKLKKYLEKKRKKNVAKDRKKIE